jgi:hypothetical protein
MQELYIAGIKPVTDLDGPEGPDGAYQFFAKADLAHQNRRLTACDAAVIGKKDLYSRQARGGEPIAFGRPQSTFQIEGAIQNGGYEQRVPSQGLAGSPLRLKQIQQPGGGFQARKTVQFHFGLMQHNRGSWLPAIIQR